MKEPSLAIVDNFGIVRQSYYMALKEMGFNVSVVSSSWEDFNNKVASATSCPDICLINVDSSIYRDLVNDAGVRSYVRDAKIIGYSLYDEIRVSPPEYVDVYPVFNTNAQKLRDLIYSTHSVQHA